MTRTVGLAPAAALLMLGAQPCLAADDYRTRDLGERRTAMFVGANVKLGLGQQSRAKPEARLQLGMRHNFAGSSAARQVAMVELGEGRTGKPAFYMAGQDVGEMEEKLAVKGTTGNILIGVAIGVAVLLVIAAASWDGVDIFCPAGEKC
jgi:hypothetical protein